MELSELRTEIDDINNQLLDLFLRRMELSEEVAAYKLAHGLPVLNQQREEEILEAMAERAGRDMAPYACQLFSAIFTLSRARQEVLLHRQED